MTFVINRNFSFYHIYIIASTFDLKTNQTNPVFIVGKKVHLYRDNDFFEKILDINS